MNENNVLRTHHDKGTTYVTWRGKRFAAAIGKNGIIDAHDKREGDGCTPSGCHRVTGGIFRPDRIESPQSQISFMYNQQQAGWCDDPAHVLYNRHIIKPFTACHEELWREDHVYDIILITDHNTDPTIPHHGSAIFIHIAAEETNKEKGTAGLLPTAGCLALRKEDLLTILHECEKELIWVVE